MPGARQAEPLHQEAEDHVHPQSPAGHQLPAASHGQEEAGLWFAWPLLEVLAPGRGKQCPKHEASGGGARHRGFVGLCPGAKAVQARNPRFCFWALKCQELARKLMMSATARCLLHVQASPRPNARQHLALTRLAFHQCYQHFHCSQLTCRCHQICWRLQPWAARIEALPPGAARSEILPQTARKYPSLCLLQLLGMGFHFGFQAPGCSVYVGWSYACYRCHCGLYSGHADDLLLNCGSLHLAKSHYHFDFHLLYECPKPRQCSRRRFQSNDPRQVLQGLRLS
mmetsp:Transcript_58346/g.103702  ORF Transcript_58346/g.103702 Transcript_58346/m.103702 type:complete len:283 (+) Transcript_58346:316-1164(+)